MADLEVVERDAVISGCGKYRYLLRRVWSHERMRALFVMLTPSTADAEIDDATIRSCTRLCKSWGYGSFEVVNLFGWRATDPKELTVVDDPVGADNDGIAEAAVARSDVAICAWGANPAAEQRALSMWAIIKRQRPAVFCLGRTKHGCPKHPLYIKTGTAPVVYCVP